MNLLDPRRVEILGAGGRARVGLMAAAGLLLLAHPVAAAAAAVPPAAAAPSSPFPAGAASSGWIPFEFFDRKRIFIPAEINGVPTQVMLDSGASQTVIDARFVKTLQIKATGHFIGQGAGGSAAVTTLHGVNIKLGAITFRDTDSVGIDLLAVEKQVGHDLPVVLGGDAFAQCVVDIDFAHRRIAFRNPARFDPPADATAAAVTQAGENFAIQANIEGRPARLVFDIGNGGPLDLNSAFWASPGFLGTRRVSTTKSGGLGGMSVAKLIDIKDLEVGGARFSQIPTILWSDQKAGPADGNIGLPILRRFHLMVDLPHGRVLFAPPVDATTPFDANHTGLTLAPGPAGEKVLYVAPDSPAQAAGLKAGDLIVTIDGMSIADWEARAGADWIYGAPGRNVRLGLAEGAARSLTFGVYF